MRATINGHASVLVEAGNGTILVDPVFDDVFASGTLCFRPPRRIDEAGLCKNLTALVVTHAHLDHFHPPTLARFEKHLPLFAPRHDLLLSELNKLGFRNVIPLGPWERFETNGVTLTATPSDFEWEEFGLVFEHSGARYWHMSDSIVTPEVGEQVRETMGPVALVATKYQPVRTLIGYQRGVSGMMLDRNDLVNAFSAACAADPVVLFPYAHGFAFHGEYAWANRHLAPYSAPEAADLLRRHLARRSTAAPGSQRVLTVQPGDVFEIHGRRVEHLPGASALVTPLTGPPVQEWEPVDISTLAGLETAEERQKLARNLRALMQRGVLPWIELHLNRTTGAFDLYRELQVIWQGVIHCGGGERLHHTLDFRAGRVRLTLDALDPQANVFTHLSGRSLLRVLEGRAGAEVFWMAGGYRQYEKILVDTPAGLAPPPCVGWELLDRLPDPISCYLRKVGVRLLTPPKDSHAAIV